MRNGRPPLPFPLPPTGERGKAGEGAVQGRKARQNIGGVSLPKGEGWGEGERRFLLNSVGLRGSGLRLVHHAEAACRDGYGSGRQGVDLLDGLAVAYHDLAGDSELSSGRRPCWAGAFGSLSRTRPKAQVGRSRRQRDRFVAGQEVAGEDDLLVQTPVGAGNAEGIAL